MNYSKRFLRIAQLLFTSDISDEESSIAQKVVEIFDKAELDLQSWIDAVENNLNVFKNYHGKETSLVVMAEKFEEMKEDQKVKYERIIATIKQAIELLNKIQDVEMQDMVSNLTKASEEFTEQYNEMADMPVKIGEVGFIQQFKDLSQKLLDNNEPFFDVISRIRDYMQKNILGEQSLT